MMFQNAVYSLGRNFDLRVTYRSHPSQEASVSRLSPEANHQYDTQHFANSFGLISQH